MSHQSTINKALMLINMTVNELGLPRRVRNGAVSTYAKCRQLKLTQGRRNKCIAGACLLINCRLFNYPISESKLCQSLEVTLKELIRTEKFINKFLRIKTVIDPSVYVTKFCHELGLSESMTSKALSNIALVDNGCRAPKLVAVISIYLTGEASMRILSNTSGVGRNSISRLFRELRRQ